MSNAIKDELIDIALLAAIEGLSAELTKRILEVAIKTDNSSRQIKPVIARQPSILAEPISTGKAHSLTTKYISRHAVGESVSTRDVCNWIEHDIGIVLTEADLHRNTDRDSPIWRQRISRSLSKLRDTGFLENGNTRGSYVIIRKP